MKSVKAVVIADQMVTEAVNAVGKYKPFNSAHEGLAVLQEEFEELKAEVFKNHSKQNIVAMRNEAIQVGAMALRFIHDVCDQEIPG